MRRSDLKTALLLALLAFTLYNANLRPIAQGDSMPARFLPFLLWHHHTLYLDPMVELVAASNPHPYWILRLPDGHHASLYPVVTPLLVAPLYLPAVAWMSHRGWTGERLFAMATIMEKLAASTVASLSVFLLYLTLRRRTGAPTAVLLAVAYAFGTDTWTISSQALWQHGAAQLFLVAALWAVTGPASRWTVPLAGLALGLLPANRPPDLLLALGFLPFLWGWTRGRRLPFLLSAALPCLLTLAFNLAVYAHPAGGYGVFGLTSPSSGFFHGSILEGVAGLLVSPARGLFVFSPFFLFLPFGLRKVFREGDQRLLAAGLLAAVVLQLLLYARTDWRGGFSWGYRFLTDLVPILIWLLVPIVEEQRRLARGVFLAALLFSVWVQTIGAFRYLGTSDRYVFRNGDPHDQDTSPAWDLAHCPILIEARSPYAPRLLVYRLFSL